jgi:Tfp pilus assembly protein FimV
MDGVFIAGVTISIHQKQKMRALSFSTQQTINEPAINLIIDINCETQLHREFAILLDPPDASIGSASIARDPSPFAKTDTSKVSSQTFTDVAPTNASSLKSTEKNKKALRLCQKH